MNIEKKAAKTIQNRGKVCRRVKDLEHDSRELAELPESLPDARREVFPPPHMPSSPEKSSFLLGK